MRHAIIAVLLLAALSGTAVAGPYEDAISAYERPRRLGGAGVKSRRGPCPRLDSRARVA